MLVDMSQPEAAIVEQANDGDSVIALFRDRLNNCQKIWPEAVTNSILDMVILDIESPLIEDVDWEKYVSTHSK